MVTYAKLKRSVIDVIDDFAKKDDIGKNYGSKYSAKTKLDTIGVTAPVRAVMPKRFNKVMRNLVGTAWRPVGSIDLVATDKISDMISIACGQSGVALPQGEPK